MRWVSRTTGGLLGALSLSAMLTMGADEASARTDRLAVIPIIIQGEYGQASISSVFDDVSDAANFRVGLAMVPNEELFMQREEAANRIRECGSDRDCIIKRLRAFDARLGLVVTVNLAIEPPLVGLQLANTDDRRMVAETFSEVSPEEGNVSDAIRSRMKKILDDAGYVRAGRIVVDIEPKEAQRADIALEGDFEPQKGAPNVFVVPPGEYGVSAELDGWSSDKNVAQVDSGAEVHVKLTLEEETTIWESPWFWAAVGVVAVGAGTTAVLLGTRSTSRCLCVTFDGSSCPCEE